MELEVGGSTPPRSPKEGELRVMVIDILLVPLRVLAVLFGVIAAVVYAPLVVLLGADESAISSLGEAS